MVKTTIKETTEKFDKDGKLIERTVREEITEDDTVYYPAYGSLKSNDDNEVKEVKKEVKVDKPKKNNKEVSKKEVKEVKEKIKESVVKEKDSDLADDILESLFE